MDQQNDTLSSSVATTCSNSERTDADLHSDFNPTQSANSCSDACFESQKSLTAQSASASLNHSPGEHSVFSLNDLHVSTWNTTSTVKIGSKLSNIAGDPLRRSMEWHSGQTCSDQSTTPFVSFNEKTDQSSNEINHNHSNQSHSKLNALNENRPSVKEDNDQQSTLSCVSDKKVEKKKQKKTSTTKTTKRTTSATSTTKTTLKSTLPESNTIKTQKTKKLKTSSKVLSDKNKKSKKKQKLSCNYESNIDESNQSGDHFDSQCLTMTSADKRHNIESHQAFTNHSTESLIEANSRDLTINETNDHKIFKNNLDFHTLPLTRPCSRNTNGSVSGDDQYSQDSNDSTITSRSRDSDQHFEKRRATKSSSSTATSRNREHNRSIPIGETDNLESGWGCSVCTYHNPSDAFKCLICDVRKGMSTRKPRVNAQLLAAQVAKQQQQIQEQAVKASARQAEKSKGTSNGSEKRRSEVDSNTSKSSKRRSEAGESRKNKQETETNNSLKDTGVTDDSVILNAKPAEPGVSVDAFDLNKSHTQQITINNVTIQIVEYELKVYQSNDKAPETAINTNPHLYAQPQVGAGGGLRNVDTNSNAVTNAINTGATNADVSTDDGNSNTLAGSSNEHRSSNKKSHSSKSKH